MELYNVGILTEVNDGDIVVKSNENVAESRKMIGPNLSMPAKLAKAWPV